MASLSFAASVEASKSTSRGPIPAGVYTAIVSAEQEKPVKSGAYNYIEVEFTVVDGEFDGRRAWQRFLVGHPDKAVSGRHQSDMKALMIGCGLPDAQESSELRDIPFSLKLGVKKNKESGEDEQAFYGYSTLSGAAPANAVFQQKSAAPASSFIPPPAPAGKPAAAPWAK